MFASLTRNDNVLISLDDNDVYKVGEKLHGQFGHPSDQKLIDLILKAKIENPELVKSIQKISETCKICQKIMKRFPKPIISLPLASKFNEVIALDLEFWYDKYFLVMVDMATRFCSVLLKHN